MKWIRKIFPVGIFVKYSPIRDFLKYPDNYILTITSDPKDQSINITIKRRIV